MSNYIKVTHTQVEGMHFFTSGQGYGQGLCVANNDLDVAMAETKIVLKKLLKLNHGMNCDIEPAFTKEDLLATLASQQQPVPHITQINRVDWKNLEEAA